MPPRSSVRGLQNAISSRVTLPPVCFRSRPAIASLYKRPLSYLTANPGFHRSRSFAATSYRTFLPLAPLRRSSTMVNVEHLADSLEKPVVDNRSYRVIRLPNKLEALLVHDPDTDKASASANMNVGNFSDDDDMPGMAHAVEHLLFMGTEKVRFVLSLFFVAFFILRKSTAVRNLLFEC